MRGVPVSKVAGNLRGHVGGIGIFIEQAAMSLATEQGLVLMLAVNIAKHIAELLQLLHGAALAIDIPARTALNSVDTAQNTFILSREVIII